MEEAAGVFTEESLEAICQAWQQAKEAIAEAFRKITEVIMAAAKKLIEWIKKCLPEITVLVGAGIGMNRVAYLATHAKKARTRKKNMHRLIKELRRANEQL